ncbi:MAG TPA: GNAT family N-acetyltransferase [Candidatus Dormibacteraeota bacterium]
MVDSTRAEGVPPSELELIRDFDHRVRRGSATEVVSVEGGFAVLNGEFPASYEHNGLVVGAALEPSLLMAEADRVLGGAGLSHRSIDVELDGLGAAWLDEFRRAGYEVLPTLLMVWRREAERTSDAAVERVSLADLESMMARDWRRDLPGAAESTIHQLVQRRTATERACQVTYHAVRGLGGFVARCCLYRLGTIAQVEDVVTDSEMRGRGYATAVVLDAVKLARAGGSRLIFLVAAADDWPQHLYERLGFERVGAGWTLQRASRP